VSGCASLHLSSIQREDWERLGPAGRTFVVLGKRWALDSQSSPQVVDVPPLQANIAFAEAYIADGLGSRAGFNHRHYYRFYVNDYTWLMLQLSTGPLIEDERQKLHELGAGGLRFPDNIRTSIAEPITVEIFHRKRKFYSLLAPSVRNIATAIRIPGAS